MKKFFSICFLLFFLSMNSQSQNYQKTNHGVKLKIDSIEVEIQFYNPYTVRILKSLYGKPFDKNSLSVTTNPQNINFTINEKNNELRLKSNHIQIYINLTNGIISFWDEVLPIFQPRVMQI